MSSGFASSTPDLPCVSSKEGGGANVCGVGGGPGGIGGGETPQRAGGGVEAPADAAGGDGGLVMPAAAPGTSAVAEDAAADGVCGSKPPTPGRVADGGSLAAGGDAGLDAGAVEGAAADSGPWLRSGGSVAAASLPLSPAAAEQPQHASSFSALRAAAVVDGDGGGSGDMLEKKRSFNSDGSYSRGGSGGSVFGGRGGGGGGSMHPSSSWPSMSRGPSSPHSGVPAPGLRSARGPGNYVLPPARGEAPASADGDGFMQQPPPLNFIDRDAAMAGKVRGGWGGC